MQRHGRPVLNWSERINVVVTNGPARRWLTRFIGWLSRRRHPLVVHSSIRILQFFAGDLRLDEARRRDFRTLQDCFTRELKPGARPVCGDGDALVAPCDGELMAAGEVTEGRLIQAKGLTYTLDELVGDAAFARHYAGGVYATLRLRANMYHRFHAPDAGRLRTVHAIAGDVRNVNPAAIKCLPRVYCRNFRAVLPLHIAGLPRSLLVVPVAAVGVASLKIHGLTEPLGSERTGNGPVACDRQLARGDELGYFLQGSTVVVIAPAGVSLAWGAASGQTLRVGRPLMRRRSKSPA